MDRTLIKLLRRASRIALSLILTALVAVGCAEDDVDTNSFDSTGAGLTLDSLILDVLGDLDLNIEIDNEARTVDIYGLTQGDLIVGVDFVASDETAAFVPSLASKIGSWDKSFTAILCTSATGATYTFNLPDYVRGDSNTVYIDIDNPYSWKQEVGYMGVDMERSGDNLIQWPNVEEGVRWAFSDCKPEFLRMSYDKKQELTEGVYNWAFYDNVIAGLDYIHAVNPNVKLWCTLKSDYGGYNNENNFPDWFSTYSGTDGYTSVELDEYAGFLARFLWYFNSKGHPIAIVSTAKEYTAAINTAEAMELIPMIIDSLKARNVPIPLFNDPSAWGMGTSAGFAKRTVENEYYTGDALKKYDHSYLPDVATNPITSKLEQPELYWGFCSHAYNGTVDEFVEGVDYVTAAGAKNCYGEEHYAIHSEYNGAVIGATSGVEATVIHNYRYMGKANSYELGLQGELNFEYWNDGTTGTRAIHCKRDGTDAYRLHTYYMLKSHINYFREKMHYLSAEQINMRSGVYTMQFADWGTNVDKTTDFYGGVKGCREIVGFNQTIGPKYTENFDGQLYFCIVNESGSAISSVLLDLGNKRYNGSYEMHVMDNETVIVNEDKAGYYLYGNLDKGTIDFSMPDDSVIFFKIDLTESDYEGEGDEDDDDTSGDTSSDSDDSIVLEGLTDDGNAWEVK